MGCFSSKGFDHIKCFKEELNAKLVCEIYKCDLSPTAWNQFGSKSNPWKLQEVSDLKHISNLVTEWGADNGVQKIDWPSKSPDLAPIENVWQLIKIKQQKRKVQSY